MGNVRSEALGSRASEKQAQPRFKMEVHSLVVVEGHPEDQPAAQVQVAGAKVEQVREDVLQPVGDLGRDVLSCPAHERETRVVVAPHLVPKLASRQMLCSLTVMNTYYHMARRPFINLVTVRTRSFFGLEKGPRSVNPRKSVNGPYGTPQDCALDAARLALSGCTVSCAQTRRNKVWRSFPLDAIAL